MGNSQSSSLKCPTSGTLPPPPSPFLAVDHDLQSETDTQGVMAKLITALSSSAVIGSSRLPPPLHFLDALFSQTDNGVDLRVIFCERAFAVAFPMFADIRTDLLALSELIRYAQRIQDDSADVDYYILARCCALKNPSLLFSILLSVCIQGFQKESGSWQEDLPVRLSIVNNIICCILKRVVSALDSESPSADVPILVFIRGTLSKFEFLQNSFVLLQQQTHILPNVSSGLRLTAKGELEDSLFSYFLSCCKTLYAMRQFNDAYSLCSNTTDLFEHGSPAILPISRLLYIQCKCAIWMGDLQASINISETIASDIPSFIDLINDHPPTGIIPRYGPNQLHFYYHLLCISSDANNHQMIIHFGKRALQCPSETDNGLRIVISTMVFVSLLDTRAWLEAYQAIRRVPDLDKQRDCMKRFLAVLLDHEELAGDILCSLPLVDFYALVEETLLLKARKSTNNFRFLHRLLFIFYINHGDYRGAAGAVYRLADRTGNGNKMERKRCLLLAVSCLELTHPDFQWIAVTRDDEVNIDEHRQLFLLSLDDIRSELNNVDLGNLDDLLANGQNEEAWRCCKGDILHIKTFINHFAANQNRTVLEFLEKLPVHTRSEVLKEYVNVSWLMDYLRKINVNYYLRLFPSEENTLNAIKDHSEKWKEHQEKRSEGILQCRPADIISNTLVAKDKETQKLYAEYLRLVN